MSAARDAASDRTQGSIGADSGIEAALGRGNSGDASAAVLIVSEAEGISKRLAC
jgi:L-aminopeptidase/D-esterase-like protein